MGLVLYIKVCLHFNRRENFSTEIENIFIDVVLPKIIAILVSIHYNPFKPDFLGKLSAAIASTDNFDNKSTCQVILTLIYGIKENATLRITRLYYLVRFISLFVLYMFRDN